ncbi:MAG: hypothetical protein V1797_14000, partial [Pseudomonadota bacterium]
MARGRVGWTVVALVLALAGLAGAAAGPAAAAEEGLQVKLMPTGEVERLTQVVARFSRPMRALGAMDQAAADAPLKLDPAPPGAYRWLDPQTLAYVLAKPVATALRVRLSVPAGAAALDGARLAKAVSATLETPAIAALEFFPAPGQALGPRPRLRVSLNQPVDLAALGARAHLECAGRRRARTAHEQPRAPRMPPGPERMA